MSKKTKVLYISYDGMTDALGQSQVLAYLKRLSNLNYDIEILSYEKPGRFIQNKGEIEEEVNKYNIKWSPLLYTKSPPIISTLKDLFIGWRRLKSKIENGNKYDIVHCRGYIAAIIGVKLKKTFGIKFIFDMRGWWADEKLESGLWNNLIFKLVYNYFKKLEKDFFNYSDYSVSLTYAGKEHIVNSKLKETNVEVIPTCVDFNVFKPFSQNVRDEVRAELNIPPDTKVLLYSGALGANYNNEGIFKIYSVALEKYSELYFLILSKDEVSYVSSELKKYNIDQSKIRIVSSPFNKVNRYLNAGDIGIILYKKQFSAIGRSPTKLGEYWACGLPVISINGLGDLDEIIKKYPEGGNLILDLTPENILQAMEQLFVKSENKMLLRKYAEDYFSIESGVEKYNNIYKRLKTMN
jgi:glycosyltransferase involved in cell wall biosynthesis